MKLKVFLGIFCCTIDQKLHFFRTENGSIADTIKYCDVNL